MLIFCVNDIPKNKNGGKKRKKKTDKDSEGFFQVTFNSMRQFA